MTNIYTIAQAGQAKVQQTPAAQTAAAQQTVQPVQQPRQPSFTDGLGGMLPFILIIGAMFFLMWRGQSKERKRREEMLASLTVGSKIITAGGIYGVIDEVSADTFKIRIADNVRIEVSRNAVSVKEEAAPAKKDAAKK